jgi:GntR family transcriptional repressor for pyruvate dehydrogenase complex
MRSIFLHSSESLTDRLASVLTQRIQSGLLPPDARLPTEQKLAQEFGVSRTVVREAVSRLKSMGLLNSRQGAGVFVAPRHQARPLAFDPAVVTTLEGVLQVVEVRRGLEASAAELAAQRINPQKAEAIAHALASLEACPPSGPDGVEADLAFHRCIARATDNPHFERLLGFLEQYLRDAMRITRTNESMDGVYMDQVHNEHRAIAHAVMRGDPAAAREAAERHLIHAAERIQHANPTVLQALEALLCRSQPHHTA